MARERTWLPCVTSRTPQTDEVAATQPAVDREVEHGEVSHLVGALEVDVDGPDVFGFERCLLANEPPLVSGFSVRTITGFHDRLLVVDRGLILEPVASDSYRGKGLQRTIGH